MQFKNYLDSTKKDISIYFKKIIEDKSKTEPAQLKDLKILSEIEEFALRGKLIRGTLFILTCRILGQKITDDHLKIAAAIELIHSGLLIHDDIIDNDRMRRGEKSVFAKYEERAADLDVIDASHYGKSMAIVVADAAYFYAFEIISQIKYDRTLELLNFLAKEIYLVCLAEGLDSQLGQSNLETRRESILEVYKYKTARYTFSMPFTMGCIYSNSNNEIKKTLDELGEKAGLIFQLKDDEIGFFGKEEEIGKPVGSDIRENKKTIFRDILFKKADANDRLVLEKYFGNADIDIDQIEIIRALAIKYEVKKEIKEMTDSSMKDIRALIKRIDVDNKYMDILRQLLDYNLDRKS